MFQPKVTPDGNVHCCAPPSQMWKSLAVLDVDMMQVS